MIEFTESGMNFSIADDRGCYIEKSPLYKELAGKGVSAVEVLRLSGNNLVQFIEAKSGAARSEENENFSELMISCRKKFEDSLMMIYAVMHEIKRPQKLTIGKLLRKALEKNSQFQFVLIVKDRDEDGCIQVRDALSIKMRDIQKIFGAEVIVVNEAMAKKRGLISGKGDRHL